MLYIREIKNYYLIVICIVISSFMSNPVSAEMIVGPVSTINALTSNIIQIHPSFVDKITAVKNNTDLSEATLSNATNLENNVFILANQWKNILQPTLYWRKQQIMEYNTKFDDKLKVIKEEIEVQQQVKDPTLQKYILIDLMHLQSDITDFKDGFTELLTQINGFKQAFAQNSQQLQMVNTKVKVLADGYDTIGAKQKFLYAQVLYNHIDMIIGNINGPNTDGNFVTLSLLSSLESLNTKWNELDAMLSSLVDEVNRASQLNTTFMKNRLQTVQDLWKLEIVDKLNLYCQ
ncbi:hypothetical protein [Bacillus sp. FSL K6-0268]|uniref:hypothetical protein n=1 Tax=Bacillus sp. FSL K6-0268 TaxID=2921449 RepID=UPI0030F54BD3